MGWKHSLGLVGLLSAAPVILNAQTASVQTLQTRDDSVAYLRDAGQKIGFQRVIKTSPTDSTKFSTFGFVDKQQGIEIYAEVNPDFTIISCERMTPTEQLKGAYFFDSANRLIRAVRANETAGDWWTAYINVARHGNEQVHMWLSRKGYSGGAVRVTDVRPHTVSTLNITPGQTPSLTGEVDDTHFVRESENAGSCLNLSVHVAQNYERSFFGH